MATKRVRTKVAVAKQIPCYEVTIKGEYFRRRGKDKDVANYVETFRVPAEKVDPEQIMGFSITKALPRILKSKSDKYRGYAGVRTHFFVGPIKSLHGAGNVGNSGSIDVMGREDIKKIISYLNIPLSMDEIKDDTELRNLLKIFKVNPKGFADAKRKVIEAQEEEEEFALLNPDTVAGNMDEYEDEEVGEGDKDDPFLRAAKEKKAAGAGRGVTPTKIDVPEVEEEEDIDMTDEALGKKE